MAAPPAANSFSLLSQAIGGTHAGGDAAASREVCRIAQMIVIAPRNAAGCVYCGCGLRQRHGRWE
eukprot:gene40394-63817_t